MKKTAIFLFCLLLLANTSTGWAEIIHIDDFKDGLDPGWQEKKFVGATKYLPTVLDGKNCLMAASEASASGLFYKITVTPEQQPILAWSWKIADIIAKGDSRSKAGDDYAARLYVVFPAFFFWQTRTINYIWANKLPKGQATPSAFTGNSIMIAVQSGKENTGKWLNEERDIYADYKKNFGGEPPEVGAIAIMTDTDNTGGKAMAWYGPITVVTKKSRR